MQNRSLKAQRKAFFLAGAFYLLFSILADIIKTIEKHPWHVISSAIVAAISGGFKYFWAFSLVHPLVGAIIAGVATLLVLTLILLIAFPQLDKRLLGYCWIEGWCL